MNSKIRLTVFTFNKRELLIKIYLITIITVSICAVLYLTLGVPHYKTLLISVFIICLSAGLLATLRSKNVKATTHYYLICIYLFLIVYTSTTGGVEAPGIMWLLILPLVSFLMLSTRHARTWLIVTILTMSAFHFFDDYLVVDIFHRSNTWYYVSHVMLFPMVYHIIRVFRKEVSKKSIESERLNQLLRVKQVELEAYQEQLILQRDLLKIAEEAASSRSKKLGDYLDQLLEIHRMEELHTGSLEYAINTLQQILIKGLNVESVTTWKLNTAESSLDLVGSLNAKGQSLHGPAKLCMADFSQVLELLESGAIVHSARGDQNIQHLPFMFGENVHYHSVCCPFFIHGKFEGFFRCVTTCQTWSPEDVMFVRAISDALPLAFKSHHRKQQQLILDQQQQEIKLLNESLEKKVQERTAALELTNKQLVDLAFINAHEIRGPVCRLLGLQDLLTRTTCPKEAALLREYISVSIRELDLVTKRTSEQLNRII